MPQETKRFVCQEAQHNKYWFYNVDGLKVTVKWGRLGGSESSQIKTFSSHYELNDFISNKVSEKLKKGYKEVTDTQLQKEVKMARTIGHMFKIEEISWVGKSGNSFFKVKNYDPSSYVQVKVLNSWSKEVRFYVINKKEGYEISDGHLSHLSYDFAAALREQLMDLFKKVQEIMVVKFAAVGSRKLDLGDGNEVAEVAVSENMAHEIQSDIGDSNVSTQVISTFAAVGRRVLDL